MDAYAATGKTIRPRSEFLALAGVAPNAAVGSIFLPDRGLPRLLELRAQMAFTENRGVRLHWGEQGQGSPLLLVMGHRYSSAMWYPALDALAAEHRVIWFDNRGTGESGSTKRMSVADMSGDALAVMDAAGVARAHLFGVSMGGMIVQDMALRAPERVRSMVLGCTGILSAEKPRMPDWVRVLYHLPPWLLTALTPSRRGLQGYGSAAPSDRVARDQAVLAREKLDVSGVAAQARAISEHCVTHEAVASLTQPALVLHGDEDAVVPFPWGEELARTLPNARFVRFAGAGHNFMVAAPDAANAAVLAFLREMDASQPA